jgi:hypothetical protein
MALRRWFVRRYLTADPRALGAGRIALAVVLLLDLGRRARDLETWYTNDGLLPNHTVLWRPPFDHTLSLFFTASLPSEAAVGFVLCGIAYTLLLLGFRTRLSQVMSLIAVLSLHGRCEFVQNGGDAVLGELALWSCFLPTGRRFSIDAVRAAREAGAESAPDKPVVELGVLVLTLQLAVIYAFNALQKTGKTWHEGSVVHYMLYQAGNDTWLAVALRNHFTLLHSKIFTYTAWAIEGTLPWLILSPFWRRYTRRAAICLVIALHAGFATFLNLGIFVPAMIAYAPNLLVASDCDALERALVRLGNAAARSWRAPALVHAGFEWLVARATPPRVARSDGRSSGSLRPEYAQGLLAVIAACATSQLIVENGGLTNVKPEWQPKWMHATAAYLQAYQGWSMYAPDPPFGDLNLVVDAITRDGRHVDPFNEVASPGNRHPGRQIPPRLGQDVLYFAYVLRMPWTPDYWQAFEDWVLAYPKRTGRDENTIVSFEALLVEQDSPPPGEHRSRNLRTRSVFKYPHQQ